MHARARRIALYWIVQAAAIFFGHLPLAAGEIPEFRHYLDTDYIMWQAAIISLITLLQAAILSPVPAPREHDSPRPTLLRLLSASFGVAAFVVSLLLLALWALWNSGIPALEFLPERLPDLYSYSPAYFAIATITLGLALFPIFRSRWSQGMDIKAAVIVIACCCAGLFAAWFLAATSIYRLLASQPSDRFVMFGALIAVVTSWAIATPLLLAFMRKGDRITRLQRLAAWLLTGTIIETVAIIPLDVMIRRRSSCYCSEGTYWALLLLGSVGAVILGPAVYLLPLGRRRRRLAAGQCIACGYDMTAIPEAARTRCPECGAGWRDEPAPAP